ncbi:hypothetical protein M3Y94_00386400 [Aphelenchoides besseyi]|nr:hypothetical protein M3Y94_00386400 [Aphelenchoides besseyi]
MSISNRQNPSTTDYHQRNQNRFHMTRDTDSEFIEFNEEREEEEVIYSPQRRAPSAASESATIQFLTDDRPHETSNSHYKKSVIRTTTTDERNSKNRDHMRTAIRNSSARSDARLIEEDWNNNKESGTLQETSRFTTTNSPAATNGNWEPLNVARHRNAAQPSPSSSHQSPNRGHYTTTRVEERVRYSASPSNRSPQINPNMSVDYSTQDFQRSRAVIDAAAKQSENVRVRQVGDTTIMTEHRDPYSFYWQLDQIRRKEAEAPRPPRQPPLTDYVVEEEDVVQETAVLSPDSHDSGVNLESQYSRPLKEEVHPSGFSYYWHVDSGTIQREPPRISNKPEIPEQPPARSPSPIYEKQLQPEQEQPYIPQPERILVPPPAATPSPVPPAQPVIEEHSFKQITTKRQVENHDEESNADFIEEDARKSVRFAVRSLGWTEISEDDLTADRSSRAVNRAIIELSNTSRSDTPKWGNGKELIMELNDSELLLVDPESLQNIHSEKIQQIRVWGDFAYVARDPKSRRFLCHVFRCDTPARAIANTLRDICKQLMLQRQQPQSFTPVSERRIIRESSMAAPIDEVRRVIRCHFIGVTQVPRATGIDILNDAVDRLVSQVKKERWLLADVAIALSTITINEVSGGQIAQCRVRYLSFLGIGQDIKHFAFIMHTSTENFMCYVFHVEPTAATMAKTIEAACKLRYQKILDANIHRDHLFNNNNHRIKQYDF